MKKVLTTITILSEHKDEEINDSILEHYKKNVYETIKSESDEGARVTVNVEVFKY